MSADKLKADPGEIRRAIELLCEAGAVYELRALTKRQGTVSGYYDNLAALARDAARVSNEPGAGAIGVYFTINPVNRDLLARATGLRGTRSTPAPTQTSCADAGSRLILTLSGRRAFHRQRASMQQRWGVRGR